MENRLLCADGADANDNDGEPVSDVMVGEDHGEHDDPRGIPDSLANCSGTGSQLERADPLCL